MWETKWKMFLHSCMCFIIQRVCRKNRERKDLAIRQSRSPGPTGGRLIQEHFKIVFCREKGCFSAIVFFKTVLMDVWTKKKNVFWIVVWVWLYKRIAEKTAKQMTGRSPGPPRRGAWSRPEGGLYTRTFQTSVLQRICFLSMVDFWKGCIDMIK